MMDTAYLIFYLGWPLLVIYGVPDLAALGIADLLFLFVASTFFIFHYKKQNSRIRFHDTSTAFIITSMVGNIILGGWSKCSVSYWHLFYYCVGIGLLYIILVILLAFINYKSKTRGIAQLLLVLVFVMMLASHLHIATKIATDCASAIENPIDVF